MKIHHAKSKSAAIKPWKNPVAVEWNSAQADADFKKRVELESVPVAAVSANNATKSANNVTNLAKEPTKLFGLSVSRGPTKCVAVVTPGVMDPLCLCQVQRAIQCAVRTTCFARTDRSVVKFLCGRVVMPVFRKVKK